jgi:hypothetical protein
MLKQETKDGVLITYSDKSLPIRMVDTGFIVKGKAREPLEGKHHEWEEVLDD